MFMLGMPPSDGWDPAQPYGARRGRRKLYRLRVAPGTDLTYVPAAGRQAFTRLYDPVVALTMREAAWRPLLVEAVAAGLPAGGVVVDVGAGTGALALRIAARRADARVVAVDGDEGVLAIARAKPGAAAVDWRHGLAGRLPLDDAEADAAVLSLVLHHLTPEARRAALADLLRVVRPGGVLHVADWGRPRGWLPRLGFAALRLLDGRENTREHAEGRLAAMLAEAGFDRVDLRRRLWTTWGTLELWTAARPLPA
jgi:ubiquinone/menaquinone biosynthesis C-methylase UbiE